MKRGGGRKGDLYTGRAMRRGKEAASAAKPGGEGRSIEVMTVVFTLCFVILSWEATLWTIATLRMIWEEARGESVAVA